MHFSSLLVLKVGDTDYSIPVIRWFLAELSGDHLMASTWLLLVDLVKSIMLSSQ
jgi:hypothetical protein